MVQVSGLGVECCRSNTAQLRAWLFSADQG